MDLAPDFSEFCALLNAHDVEFVIVSAYALAFHGAPRFTGDLDVLVRPSEENGGRLLTAIEAFGFPVTTITPADVVSGQKVIEMGVPPVQLHVMSAIDGVTWGRSLGESSQGRVRYARRLVHRPGRVCEEQAGCRAPEGFGRYRGPETHALTYTLRA